MALALQNKEEKEKKEKKRRFCKSDNYTRRDAWHLSKILPHENVIKRPFAITSSLWREPKAKVDVFTQHTWLICYRTNTFFQFFLERIPKWKRILQTAKSVILRSSFFWPPYCCTKDSGPILNPLFSENCLPNNLVVMNSAKLKCGELSLFHLP